MTTAPRTITVAAGCLLALLASTHAAAQEGAKVDVYDGPPIFLELPEAPPKPRLVTTTKDVQKYDDGSPRIERTIAKYSDDSFVSNGPYREYYPGGQVFVEGAFAEGLPDGDWKYYHADGSVAKTVTFRQGQPVGKVEVLRPDGTTEARNEYADGKRNGVWTTFAKDGEQPRRVRSYKDGKADGVWKQWSDEGVLTQELVFKMGDRDGVAKEWDKSGSPRSEVHYKDGKRNGPSIRWSSTGEKVEQQYENGKLVR